MAKSAQPVSTMRKTYGRWTKSCIAVSKFIHGHAGLCPSTVSHSSSIWLHFLTPTNFQRHAGGADDDLFESISQEEGRSMRHANLCPPGNMLGSSMHPISPFGAWRGGGGVAG